MGRLFLAFTIVPILELLLLLRIGQSIGAARTVALVLVTGVVGAYLARREGVRALREVAASVHRGELPHRPLLDALAIFMGGALLLTPGVVTDVVGLLLLLPATRKAMQALFLGWVRRFTVVGTVVQMGQRPPPSQHRTPGQKHYEKSKIYDDRLDDNAG